MSQTPKNQESNDQPTATGPVPRNLTQNDSTVLSRIFDPESAPTAGIRIDSSLPEDPFILDPVELQFLKSQELRAIKIIEELATSGSSKESREKAIDAAAQTIATLTTTHPRYASAYNNRAQMLRFQYGDNVLVNVSDAPKDEMLRGVAEALLHDLDTAIAIATPSSPTGSISKTQARILAQAHTQRGALFHATAKALASSPLEPSEALATPHLFPGWNTERFEEASSRDFFLGGRYGNEIARAMAVHTNPCAKLCGTIVQEAIRREFMGGA
jgi:hypothetical protein